MKAIVKILYKNGIRDDVVIDNLTEVDFEGLKKLERVVYDCYCKGSSGVLNFRGSYINVLETSKISFNYEE